MVKSLDCALSLDVTKKVNIRIELNPSEAQPRPKESSKTLLLEEPRSLLVLSPCPISRDKRRFVLINKLSVVEGPREPNRSRNC